MNMTIEGDIVYFDKEENPASDIKTLMELASRKELL